MTKMAILVDNESYWVRFYMKWSESLFLKVMDVVKLLEESGNYPSLSLVQLGEEIRKKGNQYLGWTFTYGGRDKGLRSLLDS